MTDVAEFHAVDDVEELEETSDQEEETEVSVGGGGGDWVVAGNGGDDDGGEGQKVVSKTDMDWVISRSLEQHSMNSSRVTTPSWLASIF